MKQNGDIEQHILSALTEADTILNPTGWEAVPAAGGLSSRVYLVAKPGEAPIFTVRLPIPGQAWRLRRQHTLFVALETGCSCVPSGSQLLQSNDLPEGTLLVHRYATGAPAALNVVPGAALTSLARCLACLHSQSRPHYTIWPKLQPVSGTRAHLFRDRVEAVTGHATFTSGLGPERRARIDALYTSLSSVTVPEEAGWNESVFAQLHGDLTLGNIVWNGESVTLIDWEYARDGDPAEDLAYLFAEQEVSEHVINACHQRYIASGGDLHAIERAAWYAPLVALDSALWWGDYHLRQGTDPSDAEEVLGFIERAEALALKLKPGES